MAKRKGKNLRRRSSVLEFWHWMKNKIDGPDSGNITEGSASQDNSSSKSSSKKVSVSKKDAPKLSAIADEGDEH